MVKRVVSPRQGGLEVAQHRVDPAQLGCLRRLPAPARDMALMGGAGLLDLQERVQAIGDDMCAGRQVLACPVFRAFSSRPTIAAMPDVVLTLGRREAVQQRADG